MLSRIGLLVMAAAVMTSCAPDPGDAGTSRAEAQAQARTCQSLLERRTGEPVQPIDPGIFVAAMSDPRLSSRTTAEVVIRICDGIGRKRAGLPAS